MIIADDETRDKAVKALEHINSQDKDKIREGFSIAYEIFHDIANSAAIVSEINTAMKNSLGNNYHTPVIEFNSGYSYINTGSIKGDILTTLSEFFKTVDKNIPIYDFRPKNTGIVEGDDPEDEYEDEEDEEEDDGF